MARSEVAVRGAVQSDGGTGGQYGHRLQPMRVCFRICSQLVSPNEPRGSVVPFSTDRSLIKTEALALTL